MEDIKLEWFAARVIRERSYVMRYLEIEGIRHAGISDIRSLVFLHCTRSAIHLLRSDLYDRLLIYKDAQRHEPESVPDSVMQTFLIMAPFHDEPVTYMAVDDAAFFVGRRKRVISGPYKGCEGVVKRIKGERRLVVRISDRAAVMTPYIPKSNLTDIE